MQNNLEISSKTQFWMRNMQNWNKSLKSDMSGPLKNRKGPARALEERPFLTHSYEKMLFWSSRQRFLIVLTCSWISSPKNDAERIWNYLKKLILDPKCAELEQKSSFWRLVSVSWGWGNPQAATGGNQMGGRQSQPFKKLYENPLEIPIRYP